TLASRTRRAGSKSGVFIELAASASLLGRTRFVTERLGTSSRRSCIGSDRTQVATTAAREKHREERHDEGRARSATMPVGRHATPAAAFVGAALVGATRCVGLVGSVGWPLFDGVAAHVLRTSVEHRIDRFGIGCRCGGVLTGWSCFGNAA